MFGEHLRSFREQAGLTQQQLADRIFKSRTAISKMENDEQEIGITTFKEWAIITNCEIQAMTVLFGTEIFAQATQVLSLVPAFIRFSFFI
ncbi:helix-turn-helix domain-containing protein [Solibacillus sp. FSL K6-1523]|uniref:helix-turn-helix domain-containing protein n=1 Tax=Solibacillus sp. FSL K6-1523 TaxID=2921471 RepID=UPI0030FA17BF